MNPAENRAMLLRSLATTNRLAVWLTVAVSAVIIFSCESQAREALGTETPPPLRGEAILSNGRTITGEIYTAGYQPLVFYDIEKKKRILVPLSDLAGMRTIIEREEMAEKWIWKEEGFHEKIMTGEKYPVRLFLLELLYPDGRKAKGHLVSATIYAEKDDGEREKFKLVRKQTGEVGQALSDLVYISEIRFEGRMQKALSTTPASALIRLKASEEIRRVWLLHNEMDQLFETVHQGGVFTAENLPYGTYDIIVETQRAFFLQLSSPANARAKTPALAPVSAVGVEEMLKDAGDFFHSHRIIHWAGTPAKMRALMMSERRGDTTLEGAELIRRYDIFILHKAENEWKIDRRLFLSRAVWFEKKQPPPKMIVPTKELSGLKITEEDPKLEFDLALSIKREIQP